jgi:GTP1/Obg family GTP-binding protein
LTEDQLEELNITDDTLLVTRRYYCNEIIFYVDTSNQVEKLITKQRRLFHTIVNLLYDLIKCLTEISKKPSLDKKLDKLKHELLEKDRERVELESEIEQFKSGERGK